MTAVWTSEIGQASDGTTTAQVRDDIEQRRAVCRKLRAYMQMVGSLGATTNELYAAFGPSAVKRLNDIRHQDPTLDYRKVREGNGYRYWLYDTTPRRTQVPVEAPTYTPRLF